jgi:hypothetical protein
VMSRLFPGDRINITRAIHRDGEHLPVGTMGTVVSVDLNAGQAGVDWDVPSTSTLQLDVDQFGIQLCSGYGPPDEDWKIGDQDVGFPRKSGHG